MPKHRDRPFFGATLKPQNIEAIKRVAEQRGVNASRALDMIIETAMTRPELKDAA